MLPKNKVGDSVFSLYLFLSIVVLLCAIGSVIGYYLSEKRRHSLLVIAGILVIFSISIMHYLSSNEYDYYKSHGTAYVQYGQVEVIMGNRLRIYDTTTDHNFTVYDVKQLKGIHEGDIVRVVHVNGAYRAYASEVQKYVPERK